MRVSVDQFANIDRDGARLHTNVRVLRDDGNRIAVFLSPTSGPAEVYNLTDVTVTRTNGGGCSHPVCHGKASRHKLSTLWQQSEKAAANAG